MRFGKLDCGPGFHPFAGGDRGFLNPIPIGGIFPRADLPIGGAIPKCASFTLMKGQSDEIVEDIRIIFGCLDAGRALGGACRGCPA
jgi:hypothetical protein